MVQVKKINASFYAEILKEFGAAGELIKSRQEEKQGLLDEFDQECKRYFFGKISQKGLVSSIKKTNEELKRLDTDIRESMARARRAGVKALRLISAQAPTSYKATLSGISGGGLGKKKKKRVAKKRKAKKRR